MFYDSYLGLDQPTTLGVVQVDGLHEQVGLGPLGIGGLDHVWSGVANNQGGLGLGDDVDAGVCEMGGKRGVSRALVLGKVKRQLNEQVL